MIEEEGLDLLSDYSGNAVFSYFFLAFFHTTSDQRGVGVLKAEKVGGSGGVVDPISPVGKVVWIVVS